MQMTKFKRVGVKYGWLEKTYLIPIFKGMVLTFDHLVRWPKPVTSYPEERRKIYPRYRGAVRLKKDEKGREKCVACELCATVCPSSAITVIAAESTEPDREKYPLSYEIDELRCIFCGLCVEACPVDAIEMTHQFELADTGRRALLFDKEKLLSLDFAAEGDPE